MTNWLSKLAIRNWGCSGYDWCRLSSSGVIANKVAWKSNIEIVDALQVLNLLV